LEWSGGLRWRRLSAGQNARIEGVVEVTHHRRDQPAFLLVTKDFCESPPLQSRPYGRVGALFQLFDFPFVRPLVEPIRFAVPTDGSSAEPELENFLDLRQAIETFDELFAWLAVFEATVQLVAEAVNFDFRFTICD
jgi:hypothetical protein